MNVYESIPVLDHGYVRLIETYGSDERIVEAARMSTAKGFLGWGPLICTLCAGACVVDADAKPCPRCAGTGTIPGDEKLLRYLWENGHTSPFEMAGAIFEVQAPIFVFREWHRHRTQSYNELSARYTELPDLFYVPSIDRLRAGAPSATNKQGSATHDADDDTLIGLQGAFIGSYVNSRERYEWLLRRGVARELARLAVPVAQYSRMRVNAVLLNWLRFLSKRDHEKAQWEIRQYARTVNQVLSAIFPRTLALFNEAKIVR